jgi:uncharacterized pyridoxamine 5'-phosphate oxidase family protein
MEEVMEFLNKAGVYYIASVDSDGKPHLRPFGSRIIFNGKFYISMSFPKNVYYQVMDNPYVELCVMGENREWIRVAAKAVPTLDIDERSQIFEAMGRPGGVNVDSAMTFELTEVTATIYTGNNSRTINW